MTDFLSAARDELEEVTRRLSGTPDFQRYQKLTELLALYDAPQATPPQTAPAPKAKTSHFERKTPAPKINRAPNPEREHALQLAEQVLYNRFTPMKTAEIYEIIVAQGAQIGGENPQGNLSAMLSNSPAFRSHKRRGWTLHANDSVIEMLGDTPETGPDPQPETKEIEPYEQF